MRAMASLPQAGVIATLNAMDGIGTITLDDGSSLRFGASACQGFTPALGVRVRVLATLGRTAVPVWRHREVARA
jgi:hypothetical protein